MEHSVLVLSSGDGPACAGNAHAAGVSVKSGLAHSSHMRRNKFPPTHSAPSKNADGVFRLAPGDQKALLPPFGALAKRRWPHAPVRGALNPVLRPNLAASLWMAWLPNRNRRPAFPVGVSRDARNIPSRNSAACTICTKSVYKICCKRARNSCAMCRKVFQRLICTTRYGIV